MHASRAKYARSRAGATVQAERAMSPDMIALIVAIIGTGAMLAGLIVPGLRGLRRDMADLRERMARLEGLFKGFTRRESAPPA